MLEANTLILPDTKSERGRAPLLAPELLQLTSMAWCRAGLWASLAPQLLRHKLAPALLGNYF